MKVRRGEVVSLLAFRKEHPNAGGQTPARLRMHRPGTLPLSTLSVAGPKCRMQADFRRLQQRAAALPNEAQPLHYSGSAWGPLSDIGLPVDESEAAFVAMAVERAPKHLETQTQQDAALTYHLERTVRSLLSGYDSPSLSRSVEKLQSTLVRGWRGWFLGHRNERSVQRFLASLEPGPRLVAAEHLNRDPSVRTWVQTIDVDALLFDAASAVGRANGLSDHFAQVFATYTMDRISSLA